MKMPIVLQDDGGIRPAGPQDECLYCHQKIGHPHLYNCVCLERKIKVKYIFEVEIEVPWSWDKNQNEFHKNGSSWCASNSLQTLKNIEDKNGCLCSIFKCEVIDIPEAAPYRRNKKGEIID